MKNLILSIAIMLCFTACNAKNSAFEQFAENFGKSAAFAYANICNHPVLLVSQDVFGQNEDTDLEAIATSVFALDNDGKIVSLGSVRSQGTAYPVSVIDNKLIVAGHHFVSIYDIRDNEEPELIISSHEEGNYDNPDLKAMFDTFEKAEPIKFNKSQSK